MPKVSDYLEMGVPCAWVVNPWIRRAWIFDGDLGPVEVQDCLVAKSLNLQIELQEILPPPD